MMMYGIPPELDDQDREIIAARMAALSERPGYRVGDYVEFADGVTRRISYVWDWEGEPPGVQTSDGGSWHLGNGSVSFSGSLYVSVPGDSLTDTGSTRKGSVWIEHHGYLCAGSAVYSSEDFRVFRCPLDAPRY
jgi:hypothetical protein